jgi:hypothetical protein
MFGRHLSVKVLCAVVLLAAPRPGPVTSAAEQDTPKQGGTVAGIVTDKRDTWIKVRADGEEEPVTYVLGDSPDKKTLKAFKGIFTVSRVQLVYKSNGDSRQLVSIRKQATRAAGTVTGVVLHAYDWWVEVKPKNGRPDGYAANFPFDKNKDVVEKLKGLKKGDVVTIQFTTDFERHRIVTLRKIGTVKK